MTNIAVKRNETEAPVATSPNAWDASRWMRSMLGWDPFREMALTPSIGEDRYAFSPAFEVKETKEGYVFKADVPGMKSEDLEVHVTGNRLTVSGKREAEKQQQTDRYYAYERSFGSFSRAFTLPEGVDTNAVHADLRDGVLSLVVPKRPEVQPKKIAIATQPTPPKS